MESPSSTQWRRRLRNLTPTWLERRLLPFEHELERLAQSFCGAYRDQRLLDLASGASEYAPDAIALDRDFEALESRSGMRICGDAHAMPLRTAAFDAICCSAALHHFVDPEQTLREMRRCLVPGGILLLTVPHRFPHTRQPDDYRRFNRSEICVLLRSAGWTVSSCLPIGGRYWTASRRALEGLFHFCRIKTVPLFVACAPVLGIGLPLCYYYLDRLDRCRDDTLGWEVVAIKEASL